MPVAIRAATRIQDMDDANVSLGVGVDEYALTWDNDTARFVLRAIPAGVTTSFVDKNGDIYLVTNGLITQKVTIPTNIAGCEMWLDASDLATLFQDSAKTTAVTVAGQPVGAWADKSGNGVDFLQATAGARPLYTVAGGKSFIKSDGINDFLAATITARTNRTFFIVAQKVTMPLWGGTAPNLLTFNPDVQIYARVDRSAGYIYYPQSGVVYKDLGGDVFFDLDCLCLSVNGANDIKAYVNGTLTASFVDAGGITSSTSLEILSRSNNGFGAWKIYGLVSYSRTLSSTERALVEQYLLYKHAYYTTSQFWDTMWISRANALVASEAGDDNVVQEPTVIYDTNPQILAGLTNVYKMWFTRGRTTNIATAYAESADGLTWTRRAGFVVNHASRNSVIKVGSVYHLFIANWSSSYILDTYTSTDGVNWTLLASNVLASTGVANTHVFVDSDGIWKMLYEFGGPGIMYLATSADGITWTHHSVNTKVIEVTDATVGGPWIYKIGATYYMWAHLGDGSTSPTDVVRYKSTDLITWTSLGYALLRETYDEGFGVYLGQIADVSVVHVGNQIYAYYTATRDNNAAEGHIKVAIASDEWLTRES